MKNNYVSIGIKSLNKAEIKQEINSLIMNCLLSYCIDTTRIYYEISDYTEEFKYAANFLKENSLMDETPFLNEFDISEFGLMVEFYANKNNENLNIIEFLAFLLGGKLSDELNLDVIIIFNNGTIPIGHFIKGELIDSFEKYNRKFMKKRMWTPQTGASM